ncbi:hypothetical protein [Halorussus ruber]|uniref:hypothetical protein n=1 Tax=Halorussus ruber TaxID=1126238 RepID=UPI001092B235|nr:hypothetical protein [Halorussus ruber]
MRLRLASNGTMPLGAANSRAVPVVFTTRFSVSVLFVAREEDPASEFPRLLLRGPWNRPSRAGGDRPCCPRR